ncbi:MAG TPA: isoprenylcysteine carboxylmethyltransferase family protein [Bryobacteraceae bacterium]|nr:isoprenylcysteine carboxylmethyltransferase family protein [Bryobacteraceae bacterium]
MPIDADQALWLFFVAVWMLAALTSKRTVRRQTSTSRIIQAALTVLAFLLVFQPWRFDVLNVHFVPASRLLTFCGVLLTAAGIGFAIWARFTLGRNWSSAVTLKQDHELIRNGPYRIVRHPIYSGMLLALLGTAIGYGKVACLIGVAIAFLGFWIKWRTEEQFMIEQFGSQYTQYRREVKAVIPGVL